MKSRVGLISLVLCGFGMLLASGMKSYPEANETARIIADTSNRKAEPLVKAFPGAEGFAAYASGGRGGDVYIVTNLNDDGPGSFRAAVEASGPRTVIFEVSGTIELQSTLYFGDGDITIAGQTAPGDGITLKNYNVGIYNVENVIMRYMRFRLGADKRGDFDAMNGRFSDNVIVDHCSFSWSIDETVGNYDNYRMTIQWCIISESLHDSHHTQGAHGMGAFIGGTGFSFHHNLLANHHNRTPRLCGARYDSDPDLEMVDLRNNVMFNWITNSCYGGEGGDFNIVNNYYKSGPGTYGAVKRRIVAPRDHNGMWGAFYVSGNYVEGYPDVSTDNSLGIDEVPAALWESVIVDAPFDVAAVTTHAPQEAFTEVLKHAGASYPKRDLVDARATEDTRTGNPKYSGMFAGIINHPDDAGGYPVLESTPPPLDTDRDGMPDAWEDANGLDKNDPEDGKIIRADGYSNLEHYLNSLVDGIPHILRPMEVSAGVNDKTVVLTWTDLSDNEDGFILERADGDGAYVEIADLDANVENYTDNTIDAYGIYTYRLKAYNSEMETCFTEGLEVVVVDPDPPHYTVTLDVDGSGSVMLNPDGGEYVTGTEIVLLASADSGWEFTSWSGDASGDENPLVIIVDSDRFITAEFSEIVGIHEDMETGSSISIFPVPFKDEANLDIELQTATSLEATLFDLNGKEISHVRNGYYPEGKHIIRINGADLAPGSYILKISTDKEVEERIIIRN